MPDANRHRRVLERLVYRPMAHTACSRFIDGKLERASQFCGSEGRIDILSQVLSSENHISDLYWFALLERSLRENSRTPCYASQV